MCLITLSWQPASAVPLRVAANRDEFYARPALGLHHWPGQAILAGQDLQAGGTWLGLSVCAATGRPRLAALTNYRDVAMQKMDAQSRGHITASFLNSAVSARDYLAALAAQVSAYNPFNLILFDGQDLMGFESRHARAFTLPPGITSVSNADFNTPWPKLVRLRTCFEQTLATTDEDALLQDQFFELLSDSRMASDADLPQTGIPRERERILSATFITSPDYGTRASSVICIRQQTAEFSERSFNAHGFTGEIRQTLSWSKPCLPS
ncbi:MAG: NRDE family protein [Polaromonas sp.]